LEGFPRLYRFFEIDAATSGKEERLTKQLKILENKYKDILNSARHIFAIAVTSINHLEH